MTSLFLTYEEVIEIHADQIAQHGGSAGVRDEGLLRSALAQPEAMFGEEHLHGTLAAQAAAYLFHMVKNHPFVDGNKRSGFALAIVFLMDNGYLFVGTDADAIAAMLAVAAGEMDEDALTLWFRSRIDLA